MLAQEEIRKKAAVLKSKVTQPGHILHKELRGLQATYLCLHEKSPASATHSRFFMGLYRRVGKGDYPSIDLAGLVAALHHHGFALGALSGVGKNTAD